MNYVEPIRDKAKIEEMKRVLGQQSPKYLFLFVLGINTGLRISDLLRLKVGDVRGKTHIQIIEKKTDKRRRFLINDHLREAVEQYTADKRDDEYLFRAETHFRPITRTRAYQILNGAARKVGLTEIGTHTLRKTFGYHFYQRTKDVATLQQIFNHSHPSITLRYIGINQDLIDKAVEDFSL